MGAFREFFEYLWREYIQKPIDAIKDAIPDITDWWHKEVKTTFEGIKGAIPDIEKWWKDTVKDTFEGIKERIIKIDDLKSALQEKITTPIQSLISNTQSYNHMFRVWTAERALEQLHSVKAIEDYYDNLPEDVKNDAYIKKRYEDRKKEIKEHGVGDVEHPVVTWLGSQIANGVWLVTNKALPKIMEWIDAFAEKYKIPSDDVKAMKQLAQSGEFGLNAVVSFMLGVTVYPSIMSAANPYWRLLEQETEKTAHSGLLDMGTLIQAWWRGALNEEKVNDTLLKEGFDTEEIEAIKAALRYYPSPTDFIRFATRDVFREDIVKKYGYDNEWDKIASDMKEYVQKAGIDIEILRWYWRAHWVLPSPQMAFEMLHRGIITQDDIRELLRISDYAPNWIEKLIAISYSPITRVDLRRLFQIGVIDEERLLKGYKELGYSEEDAKLMVEWTKIEYTQKDRDLTKTEILRNYRIGQCTRDEAKKMLIDLGYNEEESEWILIYEDYKLYVEDIEAEAETIIYELGEGHISYDEATKRLTDLGMPERVKIRYLDKAKREVRKTTKRPSTEELKRWYSSGIISEKDFREEMSKNKWSNKYIEYFIKEVKGKK